MIGEARTRVLYVLAQGRSGSTILGNVLGEIDGFFHAGELRSIWTLGDEAGRLCGCGVRIDECPLWRSVVERGFEGIAADGATPARVAEWHGRVVRTRRLPRLLAARPGRPTGWEALDRYAEVAPRLYRAVHDVTGARLVVDSSKRVPDAAFLRLLPGVDLRVVHLVRDPRAVAYSWQRRRPAPGERKRRPPPPGQPVELARYSPSGSARVWLTTQLGAEALRRRIPDDRWLVVRYEDFVARPREETGRIVRFAGHPGAELPFVDDHTARLGDNHTAGGNPSRHDRGLVELREDDEWVRAQRPAGRLAATAVSLPLLHRYDYPVRPGRRARLVPAGR
jgi:hypothetical protein